jgi:hypothetical protein
LLGAPAPIEVVAAERETVVLDDRAYRIPCSVAFQTSLPSATALTGAGGPASLLAYRPTTVRGLVILCGAALAGRRPGSDPQDQRDLLNVLVARLGPTRAPAAPGVVATPLTLTAAELLVAEPVHGSAVLLAIVAMGGCREPAAIVREAERWLAVRLDAATVTSVLDRLGPAVNLTELEQALRGGGWGAFLRRMPPAPSTAAPVDQASSVPSGVAAEVAP